MKYKHARIKNAKFNTYRVSILIMKFTLLFYQSVKYRLMYLLWNTVPYALLCL